MSAAEREHAGELPFLHLARLYLAAALTDTIASAIRAGLGPCPDPGSQLTLIS